MRRLIFITAIILTINCKKAKEINPYPDCFNGVTAPDIPIVRNCGSTKVTAELDDNKLITIDLDEQPLNLKTTCKTFRFDTIGVNIKYYTHANHPDSVYFGSFCSDIVYRNQGQLLTWTAVSGTVTAVVSKEKQHRTNCENYQASVRLDNVRFIRQNSTQDTIITILVIKDRIVSSCTP